MKKYDAIVIGTGITGGWAAKELCERGLKTLVLDRGRNSTPVQQDQIMKVLVAESRQGSNVYSSIFTL